MNNRTDKTVLFKGVKTLLFSIVSVFLGPILISIAFANKEKPLYIPLLIIGILICGVAVYLIYRGLNQIVDSMFKTK